MEKERKFKDRSAILLLSSLAAVVGGLCCLTPIVLVLFGLATISAAASLGNVLYGEYRWLFRLAALAFVGLGLFIYFRRAGVCSLEAARRERNRIVNVSLIVMIASIGAYVFWTYVVLHYWGILAGLPWAQYDESWATPAAGVLFAGAVLLAAILRRTKRVSQPAGAGGGPLRKTSSRISGISKTARL